ncbi:MAG: ParB/RepB/Spo0J family partition protein [Sinobacteraceae bacterium]|nr:ParB/RepB/Spo0J family partition protein [Nevskiaceae bacterium]
MARKRGLGRGLDALLNTESANAEDDTGAGGLHELPMAALQSGAHQPRKYFDEAALDALADSIRAQGVVEPVIVRPLGKGYEIVAGERRWRAAQRAGLHKIPAVVRSLDSRSAMAIALVENIQRADLNPLEEAEALKRLIDECKLTHAQTSEAIGRSRASISNLLRLLELPEEVQDLVRDGRLSLGHAKVLLGAAAERQSGLAQKVVALGLSVRQTETLVKRPAAKDQTDTSTTPQPKRYADCAESLRQALGANVRIKTGKGEAGQVVIPFRNRKALQNLMERLEG